MSNSLNIELTRDQRDLLLRGLQHVRSSVLLEMRKPSPEVVADRGSQLDSIESLVSHLEDANPASATAHAS
ncbi:MAG: hypothetical protein KDA79_23225 [Planctomycetaceae bacterium]|nr:hypothetical protein [Planctomycetaceae bacterium]